MEKLGVGTLIEQKERNLCRGSRKENNKETIKEASDKGATLKEEFIALAPDLPLDVIKTHEKEGPLSWKYNGGISEYYV